MNAFFVEVYNECSQVCTSCKNAVVVFEHIIEEDGSKALNIKDNGLGIDLNVYGDLLFDMYKTFHKHKDASCTGLHITKNQVEAMRGKIFVESEVGTGITFKIVFSEEL